MRVAAVSHISKLFFENDKVKVYELLLKAGEKTSEHSHLPHVRCDLTNAKARLISSDGKIEDVETKADQCVYREATTHTAENIGNLDIRSLFVELKK